MYFECPLSYLTTFPALAHFSAVQQLLGCMAVMCDIITGHVGTPGPEMQGAQALVVFKSCAA